MFQSNKEKLTTMIGFRATKKEREYIESLAEIEGLSLSNFMRYLVTQYIEINNLKEQNSQNKK